MLYSFQKTSYSFLLCIKQLFEIQPVFPPEYKCSTKQLFYLGAPLRRSTVSLQYIRYFKLFRYEAAQDVQQSFDGNFTYKLGKRLASIISNISSHWYDEFVLLKKNLNQYVQQLLIITGLTLMIVNQLYFALNHFFINLLKNNSRNLNNINEY